MRRRWPLGAVTLAAASLAAMPISRADVEVCNDTGAPLHVAMGYLLARGGWTSLGWYTVGGSSCQTVYRGRLHNRYFYLYAMNDSDGEWGAPEDQDGGFFCVQTGRRFELRLGRQGSNNVPDCERQGQLTKQFKLFDSQGADNFRAELTGLPTTAQPTSPLPSPPPAIQASPPPAQPSAGGTACQRFPNLC
jgi:uncharacterized membrane protein